MKSSRRALLMAAACATVGCYSYHPIGVDALRVQTDVRARLTPGQLEELGDVLPGGDRVIEGRVLERGSDGVLLLVPVASQLRGVRVETVHQRLNIPNTGFTEVEVRRLDRVRTGIAVAAGAAVVGTVLARILDEAFNPGSDPGDPGTDDMRPRGFVIGIRR